jgi:uncharacterized repeat protein (TIGR01451 family)
MHTHIISHLIRFSLISLSFVSLLLVATFTPASAATRCVLSFTATSDKSSVQVGQTMTRTFSVKNMGSSTCKNVSYSLYYSPNETFVSSSPQARAGNYYWSIGTLPQNKQVSSTVITKVTASTDAEVSTEGCATANNAQDACVISITPVNSETAVVLPTPVVPPAIVTPTPIATSTPLPAPITPAPVPAPVSSSKELGIWIWNFPSQMLSLSADVQMKQLQTHGFNTVYITIDDYIDIASMPTGTAKTAAKKTYFDNLSTFVAKANALGMAVDAEGGWKDWAYAGNKWKGFALIDAVKEYNSLYPNQKLRGFQYDVEPYLLDEYETNKAKVLTEYVAFIDQSAERLVGTNIKFSMAIPHFYDAAQAWTPAITYGGKTLHTFNHLLNILEKTPGSTILLMSYRDTFEGTNGTRNIVEAELKDAIGYSTRVIVSQETGNVDPDFVTFYGSTKTEVFENLSQINTAFKSYTSHGGNAVHYMDSFLEMR